MSTCTFLRTIWWYKHSCMIWALQHNVQSSLYWEHCVLNLDLGFIAYVLVYKWTLQVSVIFIVMCCICMTKTATKKKKLPHHMDKIDQKRNHLWKLCEWGDHLNVFTWWNVKLLWTLKPGPTWSMIERNGLHSKIAHIF